MSEWDEELSTDLGCSYHVPTVTQRQTNEANHSALPDLGREMRDVTETDQTKHGQMHCAAVPFSYQKISPILLIYRCV